MGRIGWVAVAMGLLCAMAVCQEGEKGKGEKKAGETAASYDEAYVATAESGEKIPHPLSKKTEKAKIGKKKVDVPENMVFVPEGEFLMGEDRAEHKVWLDSYCIGKFEVTNAEWKAFVDATEFRPFPKHWKGGDIPEGKANHPVLYVSWEEAQKYCEWVSKETGWQVRLPTEAEWEKAASWNPKKRQKLVYPWGNQWNAKLCNSGWMLGKFGFKPGDEGADWQKRWTEWSNSEKGKELVDAGGNTMGVGSFKRVKSPYGCYDMAGNVYECCQDWFKVDYYTAKDARKNPPGPSEDEAEEVDFPGNQRGKAHVLRGGSWHDDSGGVRGTHRYRGSPSGHSPFCGFRIALSPAR